MKDKKIIITGGTGFIAQFLARRFGKNNQIILLSQQKEREYNHRYGRRLATPKDGLHITYWRWDAGVPEKPWTKELEGVDAVINLAGKSVNCRYTKSNRTNILESRVRATETLGRAIRHCIQPPKVWINAASATIYRHSPEIPQDEFHGRISEFKDDNMPYSFFDRLRRKISRWQNGLVYGFAKTGWHLPEKDFSVEVCRRWEESFFSQRTPFTRKIAFRSAIVLGSGGVLTAFLHLLKIGLGGPQGNGRQMFSWVHEEDWARAVEWVIDHPEMEGIYNLSAPGSVTNRAFMSALRRLTGYNWGLRVPAWLLEWGAFFAGTETELILKSRWVHSARLEESGYQFAFPELEEALGDIIGKDPGRRIPIRAKAGID